jgi:hypothetical protein
MANDGNGWSRGNGSAREDEWLSPFVARGGRIGTPRTAFGTGNVEQFLPLPWVSAEEEVEEVFETPAYELEEEEEGEVVLLGRDGRELEAEAYDTEAMETDEELEMDERELLMESMQDEEAPYAPAADVALEDADEAIAEWEDDGELGEGESEWDEAAEWDEAVEWEDAGVGVAARIKAGSQTIATVPLLRSHKGIGPDLILLWNDMPAAPTSVDVVVHLHGYALKAGKPLDIEKDLRSRSGLDWSDPQQAGATPGRARPTLALLPRGNFAGGKSRRKYDFPALVTESGLRELVELGRQRLATSLGVGSLAVDRLIVTAHSGGGAPLMRILRRNDPHEVHVFDGLYGSADALIDWARSRIARDKAALASSQSPEQYMSTQGGALRVLYRGGTGTATYSETVGDVLRRAIPANSPLRRRYRVERTTVGHVQIPPVFGWRLLADPSANVPEAKSSGRRIQRESPFDEAESPFDEAESPFDEAEYSLEEEEYVGDEAEDEAEAPSAVAFPSGESLPVLTGYPEGRGEDYWDPWKSGNPLLDTGPAHKHKRLSRSFTVSELTRTKNRSADVARIDPKLVENLQRLRDHVGKDITITSGYRSWKRNKEVYKELGLKLKVSQHCSGRAADIKISGMNGLQIGKAAIDACGPTIAIGLAKGFAHIDVRGKAATWDYGSAEEGWVEKIKAYRKHKRGASRTPSPDARTGGGLVTPAPEAAYQEFFDELDAEPEQDVEEGYDEELQDDTEFEEEDASAALRARIVKVAKEELDYWEKRPDMTETSPEAAPVLQRYYKDGVGGDVSVAELTDPAWHKKNAWSAVFISYVMHAARAGKAFKGQYKHTKYVCAALRAREAEDATKFWAYPREKAKPEVGDLVCKDRKDDKKPLVCARTTFDNVCDEGISHCDIVIDVDRVKNRIRTVGGNVGDRVGAKTIKLTPDGFLRETAGDGCRWIGVLKPPGAVVPLATGATSAGNGLGSMLGMLPKVIADAVRQGTITLQVALAIMSGQRDVATLTNMLFYARHPELPTGYKIKEEENPFVQQWLDIRDRIVLPLLRALGSARSTVGAPSSTPSAPSAGAGGLKNLGAGLTPPTDPSAYRKFRLTTYHVVDEVDYPVGTVRVPIYDGKGNKLAEGSPEFFAKLSLEGTARLNDGRLINVDGGNKKKKQKKTVPVAHGDFAEVLAYHRKAYAKRDEQRRKDGLPPISYGYSGLVVDGGRVTRALSFHEVPRDKRGVGYGSARGIPHTPFRTLAADIGHPDYPNVEPKWRGKGGVVPPRTHVYIKEYDGLRLPGGSTHDGWFIVNDTGGGIFGAHFDVFVGSRQLGNDAAPLPAFGQVWFAGIENRVPAGYTRGLKG